MTGLPLSGMGLDDLRDLLVGLGEPPYRAKQVFQSVQQRGALDPAAMTNLPLALRERLAEAAPPALEPVEVQTSADGTTKFLFALQDGKRVESVLIPEGDRNTVCVSSQVGCPIRCVFCASGVKGLVRNLSTAEIAEQLLRVRAHLGVRPTHVVLMGMGEPLLNLPAVEGAIRLWTDPDGLGFSPRRITVSTAGTPSKVDQLADLGLGVHLAISLHAPDDESRGRLVPGSPAGRTAGLIEAGARFARKTGRDVTVEYVMIAGENDQPEHAETLARLLRGKHIHVNLIPLNPVHHRPDLEDAVRQRPPPVRRDPPGPPRLGDPAHAARRGHRRRLRAAGSRTRRVGVGSGGRRSHAGHPRARPGHHQHAHARVRRGRRAAGHRAARADAALPAARLGRARPRGDLELGHAARHGARRRHRAGAASHVLRPEAAIGITNQRETTVRLGPRHGQRADRTTPIVWQDRRTADACDRSCAPTAWPTSCASARPASSSMPYFSGTKLAWTLDARRRCASREAEAGELAFGTIDTWLAHQLTDRSPCT